jgi:hypothetical protein
MKRAVVFGLFLAISAVRVTFPADGSANLPLAPTPISAGAYASITSTQLTPGRILKAVAWPGYSELNRCRKLEMTQALVLGMERSSAVFDIWSTWRMLSAPAEIPAYTANNGLYYARASLYEAQFPYRLFGRSRTGVVGFMVGGELAYSYLAPAIPRLIERKAGERPGKTGKIGRVAALSSRVAGIGLGIYLTEEHVRWGAYNVPLTSRYKRDYDNYLAGLPPGGQ